MTDPLANLERIAAALQAADPEARRRALVNVKARATRARQRGTPDEANAALRLVRAAGVPARTQGFPTLTTLGLLASLEDQLPRRVLYELDRFLLSTGKRVDQISAADVAVYVASKKPDTAMAIASQIRRAYAVLIALGIANEQPAPARRGPRWQPSGIAAAELEQLATFEQSIRAMRSTKRGTQGSLRRARAWAESIGEPETPLIELLWNDPAKLTELAFWWARPTKAGRQRSETCMPELFKFFMRLSRAYGHNATSTRDRLRDLKRSLRSSGDDFGKFDLLDLAQSDPPPAPPRQACLDLLATYATEVAELRAQGARSSDALIDRQRERCLFYGFFEIGVRRGSMAGWRWDQFKRDESDGTWYFDEVPTKRVSVGKDGAVKLWRIGDQSFSRWYPPTELKDLLAKALRDEGYDLEAYLRTRDPKYVPWVIAQGHTFGAHLAGQKVAAVWRGKRGHFTASGVYRVIAEILRGRLGMSRGGPHAMRRRAIIDKNPIARAHPQAGERYQHIKNDARGTYERSVEHSATYFTSVAVPANGAASTLTETAPMAVSTPAAEAPVHPRPKALEASRKAKPTAQRPARVTFDDIAKSA